MGTNWKYVSRFIIPAVVVVIILLTGIFVFNNLGESESSSFVTYLDKVDVNIKTGQTADALKLLKKASRQSYSAWARLSIFKRYMSLGEKDLAEKTLQKAIKKIPDNPELAAVYGQFLLRQNRFEEAVKITENLSGTKYGSIYAEACLKEDSKNDWLSEKLIPVYKDAYEATGQQKWLVNSALPYLKNGDYVSAAAMQDSVSSGENQFWALVHYDAGNFDLAIENIEELKKHGLSKEGAVIASDSYVNLGDFDSAEKERAQILSLSQLEYTISIPPVIAVNSALWAYNLRNYSRAYDLLSAVVLKDSDCVPALLTYGKFAWLDSFEEEPDELETYLRKDTTFRSLSMIRNDERPRFVISDALYRLDSIIDKQKKTNGFADDLLLVERLDLYLKSNAHKPAKQAEAEIWRILEMNELGTDLYPPMLVHFAVSQFLKMGKIEEARQLFTKYLDARYKLKGQNNTEEELVRYDIFGGEKKYVAPPVPDFVIKAAFGDRAAQYASTMEIWEIETAAYFSLIDENITAAKRLYEYALLETGGVKKLYRENEILAISPVTGIASAINLAMIYSATGEHQKALSLYGLASGRTKNKVLKSKILYRTALVQLDLKNENGAILSLDYAISLDSKNADARLLRKKLR